MELLGSDPEVMEPHNIKDVEQVQEAAASSVSLNGYSTSNDAAFAIFNNIMLLRGNNWHRSIHH